MNKINLDTWWEDIWAPQEVRDQLDYLPKPIGVKELSKLARASHLAKRDPMYSLREIFSSPPPHLIIQKQLISGKRHI
jgi:hypothetical protein